MRPVGYSRAIFFIAFISVLCVPQLCSALIYVPDDYPTIQAAIDNVPDKETILVRPGVYKEHVAINRTQEFNLVGTDKYTTIIDGTSTGIPLITVLQKNIFVSGFTIQNSNDYGIYATSSVPIWTDVITVISDCIVKNNQCGGIHVDGCAHYLISGCDIAENQGRGIYSNFSVGMIRDCYIAYNKGALYQYLFSGMSVYNCTIEYNIADVPGDTMGAALYAPYLDTPDTNQFIDMQNNIIRFNQAMGDGVIFAYAEPADANYFVNNFVYNNSSKGTIGTIYITFPIIAFNTIVGNNSTLGAGGINGAANCFNNIIAYNSNYGIYGEDGCSNDNYNDIFGNIPAEAYCYGSVYTDINEFNIREFCIGNISCDPEFIVSGDYHISKTSCCIDHGSSDYSPTMDLDGDIRPQGSSYDIGADEYAPHFLSINNILFLICLSIIYLLQCWGKNTDF
jgi:hypothetical protein